MYQKSENEYTRTVRRRRRALILMLIAMCGAAAAVFMVMRVFNWRGSHKDAQLLALVNPWNTIETADFKPRLTEFEEGIKLDRRCVKPLEEMLEACKAAGYLPKVEAAYSQDVLQESCEHELGLSVDIVDAQYEQMDALQAETLTQQWLMENSWQYGFVLRYPQGKEDITGIDFQPWHYRYVGKDAAAHMYQLDLTLEEYLSWFYSEEAVIEFE